ncbi:flavin reductase family protein, partial [Escherichia coli]|uniref:flavin reductase family protein n=1 Tax=Escherichia coli TaxID=562 RepID=UPI001E50059D
MSQFIPVELHHASCLLNHGPTVMITSFDEQSQRRNIMAAAWSMPVEFEPPRVAIVVDKSTWTRELIEGNGKFGIVIPGVAATNWTWAVGSVSGREEDKFNCYGIPVVRGPVLGLPLQIPLRQIAYRIFLARKSQVAGDTPSTPDIFPRP